MNAMAIETNANLDEKTNEILLDPFDGRLNFIWKEQHHLKKR
jgi:hypothetical protein